METIFRKVNANERQPTETKEYFVAGEGIDKPIMTSAIYFASQVGMNSIGWAINMKITHWLEKIELPDDKGIEFQSKNEETKNELTITQKVCWEDGAKWLRDFVLAATPK